jgi:hypothetical protein
VTVVNKILPGVAIAGLALVVAFGFDRALRVGHAPDLQAVAATLQGATSTSSLSERPVSKDQVVGKASVQVFPISTNIGNGSSLEIDTVSGAA